MLRLQRCWSLSFAGLNSVVAVVVVLGVRRWGGDFSSSHKSASKWQGLSKRLPNGSVYEKNRCTRREQSKTV